VCVCVCVRSGRTIFLAVKPKRLSKKKKLNNARNLVCMELVHTFYSRAAVYNIILSIVRMKKKITNVAR